MRVLIFLIALSAWAQTPVLITGPITDASGSPFNGRISVSNPLMMCGTTSVTAGMQNITITAGVLSTPLYATVECTLPNGRQPVYTARLTDTTGASDWSYLTIPASPASQLLSAVQTAFQPSSTLPISGLGFGSVLDGQAPIRSGSRWIGFTPGSGGGGSGSVTSVGFSLPSEFTVSGSPITTFGTLGASWAAQTQGKVLASPAAATGVPSFRALVASDIPALNYQAAGSYEALLTFSAPLSRAANTISLPVWGSGSRPVAANALGTSGNCVQWTTAGLGDTGSACGSGGGGANALGYYLVSQATSAPANAINLGLLSTGLLKMTVASSVASISAAVSGTDYAPATSGTSLLKGNGAGGFSNATAGTDYQAVGSYVANTGTPATLSIPKYNGTSGTAVIPSGVTIDASNNMVVPGTVTTGGASSGSFTMQGSTSGQATVTVAAAAGTPADLVLPIASATSGYLLSSNGSTPQQLSWVAPFALPTQTGHSGEYLTTNGTATSWAAASGGTVPVTTKGDLFTYTTAAARLGVGTDGQVLKANSAAASGLEWATASGGGDVVSTSANSYTAGARQTFAASATTAGIKITAAALPSTPATGDLAVDSGASNALKYYDGSAWQGAGGGGAAVEIAASGQGMWWPLGFPHSFAAAGTSTANRTYFVTFTTPIKITITSFSVRISTAGAAGSGMTIGIYNSACDTLLVSANKLNLSASGFALWTPASPYTLNPGTYYMAWSTDDTTVQLSAGGGNGSTLAVLAALFNSARIPLFWGSASTGTGSGITLPASCGTRTAASTVMPPHFAFIP